MRLVSRGVLRVRLAPLAALVAGWFCAGVCRWISLDGPRGHQTSVGGARITHNGVDTQRRQGEWAAKNGMDSAWEALRRSPLAAGAGDYACLWDWLREGYVLQDTVLAETVLDWLWSAEKAREGGGDGFVRPAVEMIQGKKLNSYLMAFIAHCLEDLEPGSGCREGGEVPFKPSIFQPHSGEMETAALFLRGGSLEKKRVAEMLRQISVATERGPGVRVQALHLLFEVSDSSLETICRQIVLQDGGQQVQVAALHLLAAVGTEETLGWLQALCFSEGTPLFKARFRAVSRLGERLCSARGKE